MPKETTINNFTLMGICYGNPKVYTKDGNTYATNVIVVEELNNKSYVPIIAKNDNACLIKELCRNGNKVVVTGNIYTKEKFDRSTGTSYVRVFFSIYDVMVVGKAKTKKISEKRIEELIDGFELGL